MESALPYLIGVAVLIIGRAPHLLIGWMQGQAEILERDGDSNDLLTSLF
jgi:hypothetical protein